MFKKFVPKNYKKNVFEVNYIKYKDKGIKYIIFDLDNTLGLINEKKCSNKVKDFINNLSNDFKIIIASNNNKGRVSLFSEELNVNIIHNALKPTSRLYRILKDKYTKNMNEVLLIGDQLVTDIFVGNRFKIETILVDPLGNKDLKITGLNRFLEDKIMKKIKFKRGEYYEKN